MFSGERSASVLLLSISRRWAGQVERAHLVEVEPVQALVARARGVHVGEVDRGGAGLRLPVVVREEDGGLGLAIAFGRDRDGTQEGNVELERGR